MLLNITICTYPFNDFAILNSIPSFPNQLDRIIQVIPLLVLTGARSRVPIWKSTGAPKMNNVHILVYDKGKNYTSPIPV